MPYILREPDGRIYRVTARMIPGAETLPPDHPDVISFLENRGVTPDGVRSAFAELKRTDNEMSRAVEDVITALLKKNILKMSDLPKAVQDRIAYRVRMRLQIQEAYDRASHGRRFDEAAPAASELDDLVPSDLAAGNG